MLSVKGLNAYYGESHILQDVALNLAFGKRVALLGRNGAGKSTFLKSIMNGGPRVEGTLEWEGALLADLKPHDRVRRGLALVPEDRRIFNHLTVLENLVLGSYGASGRVLIAPEEMVKRFPLLEPLKDRMGDQLSGGQQQMVAVARGLIARPKLLLLDEPTEGLAPIIVRDLAKFVVDACKQYEISLLLCEQNVWFARYCTEYVYIIDSGRIVFEGTWGSFDQDEDLISTYLAP